MTIGSEGFVLNPVTANNPISSNPLPPSLGRQGEELISELHGKFGVAAMNKALFNFNVTAVAIPLVSAAVASVFTLWNPPSSGVLAEMVDTEVGQVLATTVVDAIGWYFTSGSAALAGTFSTKAAANTNYFSARTGDVPNGNVIPYTAYTNSGTPVRVDIIGSFGAITDAGMPLPAKLYDGRMWVPPGVAMSVLASTATTFTAGLDVSCRWIEWPFV